MIDKNTQFLGYRRQNGAVGVNHVPLALFQIHFGQMRFHLKS